MKNAPVQNTGALRTGEMRFRANPMRATVTPHTITRGLLGDSLALCIAPPQWIHFGNCVSLIIIGLLVSQSYWMDEKRQRDQSKGEKIEHVKYRCVQLLGRTDAANRLNIPSAAAQRSNSKTCRRADSQPTHEIV